MSSVYFCSKCSLDFPSVSRFIKHRKLFCNLGREEVEVIPEDGIGKLTIAEASKRISRIVQLKIKEVDPEIYNTVDKVQQFKSKRRQDVRKMDQLRNETLDKISSSKAEMAKLENDFSTKKRKYDSIKAYSKVSALEVTGTEELIEELEDLKNAIIFLQDETQSQIDVLDQIESGNFMILRGSGEFSTQNALVALSKPSTVRTSSDRLHLPAIPMKTPVLTPPERRSLSDLVDVNRSVRAQSEIRGNVTSVKPSTADSVVILGKLQRKKEILLLEKEIKEMQMEESDRYDEDVLGESSLLPYNRDSGVAVYVDYITPTFHMSTTLTLALVKDKKMVSSPSTFVVTPSPHLLFLGYNEIFRNVSSSNDCYLYLSIQSLDGEEMGWSLFSLFSEDTLTTGAWRVSLKSPPFSLDLVSTLYHGVRSLNFSIRFRCAPSTVHDAMLSAPKLKLAQYKLHNPSFQDNLILSQNYNKLEKKLGSRSRDRVAETYGPPGDFDPVKALKRGSPSRSMRMMPPARATPSLVEPVPQPSPSPEVLPTPLPPPETQPPERIKGIQYETLNIRINPIPETVLIKTQYCEIDEEYQIKSTSSKSIYSTQSKQTTLLKHFSFNNDKLELEWNNDDLVIVMSFVDERQKVFCWSWVKYSDKDTELSVFKPPVPSFEQIVQSIEDYEVDGHEKDIDFPKLKKSVFMVRYYDTAELTPSFPSRPDNYFALPQPRVPTGAFRHVAQKPNFTVHDKDRSISLVIDGARYLPSCVTISRITGRIFDKSFNILGPQIMSNVVVESDVYNPSYKYHVTIPGALPSTSVAVLKMYTLHAVTGHLTTVGYCLLNLFCKRGTTTPAGEEEGVVLKEGGSQLPLYLEGPDAGQPLTAGSLEGVYQVPCAWVLVRLMYTPLSGGCSPMPSYNDGVYSDNKPDLSEVEMFVLDSHRKRPIKPGNRVCELDQNTNTASRRLTRHKGQTVHDMNPSDVIQYSPEIGFGVKIVGVKNFECAANLKTVLVYLRLSTRDSLFTFTDHILFNESLQFKLADRVKWSDQVHYFKNVVPSNDVFILVQVLGYSDETYSTIGWLTIPIYSHAIKDQVYVNKTTRSEIPLILGTPNPEKLSNTADLKSVLSLDDNMDGSFVVFEIFDCRYSSEVKTVSYEVDPEYVQIAEGGIDFISGHMIQQGDR